MKISRIVTLAAVALSLASAPLSPRAECIVEERLPATPAQIAADLKNPNNTTYVPSNAY